MKDRMGQMGLVKISKIEGRNVMKSRIVALGSVLLLSALAVSGCTTETADSDEPGVGMANPASVHCQEQGYELEMRTDDNGTYGVCVFPDGSECEEWAYFRGECEPGTGEADPTEAPVEPTDADTDGLMPDPAGARDAALDHIFDTYGEIVFPPPGSTWTEENVTEEGLVGGSTIKYTTADLAVMVSFPLVNPADTIYRVVVVNEGSGFQWEGDVSATFEVTELSTPAAGIPVVAWYGYVASMPAGGQFDDYLVLLPEEARRAVGIEGADEAIEAEIVALRDKQEPGKYAHFWGTLDCDVVDYAGCQVLVTRLRVDGPGAFFSPDPVEGWQGTIVGAPYPDGPRSGGDDYLVVLVGGIPIAYGIGSTDATLAAQIEILRDTGTIVRVWGQVSAGVGDWNGTHILVDQLEIDVEAPVAPAGYEGWKPYLNVEFGYALWYPGDCQVMGANLNESVQFSGPMSAGLWPVLTVMHYDSEFYTPPAGTDVEQWIADSEMPYDAIDTDVEIGGLPAVRLRYEGGPGWDASDAYFLIHDGQLFQILILHTGGQEDWMLYDSFLQSVTFLDVD